MKSIGLQRLAATMSQLTELNVARCRVNWEGLLSLLPKNPRLKTLDIASTRTNHALWECITTLKELESLNASTPSTLHRWDSADLGGCPQPEPKIAETDDPYSE
mgnify:CR=1 FL=1